MTLELFQRYARIFRFSWKARRELTPVERLPLERQFLPAALEISETPAPALAHAILWAVIGFFAIALLWGFLGHVDTVAVAQGKVIASGKAKLIQPAETAVVKRIHVADGQMVKAGQVLIELEVAGSAGSGRDRAQTATPCSLHASNPPVTAALARVASGAAGQPVFTSPSDAPAPRIAAETGAMHSQYAEHRAKLAALGAEIAMRQAELHAANELAGKLAQTAPIAQRRAQDYKDLADKHFVSQHGYLEREQDRIEHEGDLAVQRAKVKELAAAIEEARRRRQSTVAEFERAAVSAKVDADKRAAQLEYELTKAQTRERQQILTAPVDGTVQQLDVHTEGRCGHRSPGADGDCPERLPGRDRSYAGEQGCGLRQGRATRRGENRDVSVYSLRDDSRHGDVRVQRRRAG